MKKQIYILSIIIIAFISNSCKNTSSKDDVNISCNLPLSGAFSTYGESIKNGMLLAYNDLKDSLVNESFDFRFDIQDNKSIARDAQFAFKKQQYSYDIYVAGIAQPLYSILPNIQAVNKPCIVWGFEEYVLADYSNTFRTWVNLDAEAHNYLAFIEKNKPRKVTLVRPQTVGCELQYNNKIIPYLKQHDIDYSIIIFENTKKDFKDIAAKCKDANSDLYIVNGFDSHIQDLAKQFVVQNISKEKTYWCLDLLDASRMIDKETLEGLRVTAPLFLVTHNSDWSNRYEIEYGRTPNYTDAYAYDMMYALYYAYRSYNIKQTSYEEELMDVNFWGVTGEIAFNDNRDLIYNLVTCVYRDGKLIVE